MHPQVVLTRYGNLPTDHSLQTSFFSPKDIRIVSALPGWMHTYRILSGMPFDKCAEILTLRTDISVHPLHLRSQQKEMNRPQPMRFMDMIQPIVRIKWILAKAGQHLQTEQKITETQVGQRLQQPSDGSNDASRPERPGDINIITRAEFKGRSPEGDRRECPDQGLPEICHPSIDQG